MHLHKGLKTEQIRIIIIDPVPHESWKEQVKTWEILQLSWAAIPGMDCYPRNGQTGDTEPALNMTY